MLDSSKRHTSGEPRAANHICQSRRGWCGATQDGARAGSPGLYLTSKDAFITKVLLASTKPCHAIWVSANLYALSLVSGFFKCIYKPVVQPLIPHAVAAPTQRDNASVLT